MHFVLRTYFLTRKWQLQMLTTDSFEAAHHKHDVMIVNFFAPWCHWCQKVRLPLPFAYPVIVRAFLVLTSVCLC